jgi:type II secretory pathway predicted ATPase ExeA
MDKQSFIDLCSLLHDAQSRTSAAALILVGQPVLKKMLELDIFAPVRTRLAYIHRMQKLSIEEAKDFIRFRLKIAEAAPDLFHEEALDCIAADTAGNRRNIMNLATLCLEEAARRQEKVITADIVNAIVMEKTQQ